MRSATPRRGVVDDRFGINLGMKLTARFQELGASLH
jgi:hypothetical protein